MLRVFPFGFGAGLTRAESSFFPLSCSSSCFLLPPSLPPSLLPSLFFLSSNLSQAEAELTPDWKLMKDGLDGVPKVRFPDVLFVFGTIFFFLDFYFVVGFGSAPFVVTVA